MMHTKALSDFLVSVCIKQYFVNFHFIYILESSTFSEKITLG